MTEKVYWDLFHYLFKFDLRLKKYQIIRYVCIMLGVKELILYLFYDPI